ncbi:MAG: hypothetical protein HY317_06270 [Acidobacteria bacterium]|nr:hypothetical protein [Acidobacteriota bacterium]
MGSSTIRTKPAETFALEGLPALVRLAAEGADPTRLAQACAVAPRLRRSTLYRRMKALGLAPPED